MVKVIYSMPILLEFKSFLEKTEVRGKLAYFFQSSSVLNAIMRPNILFSYVNRSIVEEQYKWTLECCTLKSNLGKLILSLV